MEDSMITLHECIAFGGSDAIRVIAAHHNLPDIAAAQSAAARMLRLAAAIAPIVQRELTHPQ